MNFITRELYKYFRESDKRVSIDVLYVLDKRLSDLSSEEREIYEEVIVPYIDEIKRALATRRESPGIDQQTWEKHLRNGDGSIISNIASECFGIRSESVPPPALQLMANTLEPSQP